MRRQPTYDAHAQGAPRQPAWPTSREWAHAYTKPRLLNQVSASHCWCEHRPLVDDCQRSYVTYDQKLRDIEEFYTARLHAPSILQVPTHVTASQTGPL